MYPTLYHLLADLVGVRIEVLKLVNTFGLMLALAFAAAAQCQALELRRMVALGVIQPPLRRIAPSRRPGPLDIALSSAMVFLFAFKFLGVALGGYSLNGGPDAQRYLLSTQGHLIGGLACAAAWAGFQWFQLRKAPTGAVGAEKASASSDAPAKEPSLEADEAETRRVTPEELTMGVTTAAALGGLVGAKVFHWLETPAEIIHMLKNPSLGSLASGLTIYGGLIVGAVAVYRYCRKQGVPFSAVCDANAPGLMLAYAVGRLGCQLAGDGDWGIASTAPMPTWLSVLPSWFWSFDYPNNVLSAGQPMIDGGFVGYGRHLVPAVYPTPLYESIWALGSFVLLWNLRKRFDRPFVLFGVYLMLNGFARFWVEKIRVNATYDFGAVQVTQAELISSALFAIGAMLVATRARRPSLIAPA